MKLIVLFLLTALPGVSCKVPSLHSPEVVITVCTAGEANRVCPADSASFEDAVMALVSHADETVRPAVTDDAVRAGNYLEVLFPDLHCTASPAGRLTFGRLLAVFGEGSEDVMIFLGKGEGGICSSPAYMVYGGNRYIDAILDTLNL